MEVPEGFELDIENKGNLLIERIFESALRLYRLFETRSQKE